GAVIFLLLLMSMPASGFLRKRLPSKFIDTELGVAKTGVGAADGHESKPFSLAGAASGLAVSLVVCAVSTALVAAFDIESMFILVVTALSLLVANFARPLADRVSSDFELGTLFMYIFFVAIGAGANISEAIGSALPIIAFIIVMVIVHLILLVVIGGWLKLDLAEVLVASNACILGPAPAAALAASKGWQALVAPGILVGMFGYAIATFIGVGLAAVLGS
ncbi:MAG: DUF819 family protein, partial [Gammaproteobacteria bacterium]|nr:DUF819 family protein [Gammaproteobacteria bacterium]